MTSGAAALRAFLAVLIVLVLCSQGQRVAAEAIQCSQCASGCRSSCKVTSLFQVTTLQNECAECKRKVTKKCEANCYGGCGRPSCPWCHCRRTCNCHDSVEVWCDDVCSRAAQACLDCTTRCKANCFN